MQKRSKRGTIVAFLLMLAIIGLMLILALIAIEFFVRYTTLSRIQSAAQIGALSFARELVKLRDNEMGETGNNNLTFEQTTNAQGCQAPTYTACTRLDPKAQTAAGGQPITGPQFVEYLNASQVLLFQVAQRSGIQDARGITNLIQGQCYTEPQNTRFNSFGNPPTNCQNTGLVTSPITDLTWEFQAGRYGQQGVCLRQASAAQSQNKDFCVEAILRGRLDPIFAGGLPFLQAIPFIGEGNFDISARAVVMQPNFMIDAGTNSDRQNRDQFIGAGTQNYSAEAISLESCNSLSRTGPNSPCSN